ncbi:glutathione-disulfide reductase [Lysobacter sp. TY2-98]|uniref:glutathione-disulfide reductase n=1 Tax=Lysobacter sp. TY2-98 TaxID=2290922 RepID=UPI000E2078A4|nr:glutathione-disulfide reductase [Lysobacter sp. TY2-98]AXK72433.1 glutathione-disulfide reductase [Lysobacter sp. TY2-98]
MSDTRTDFDLIVIGGGSGGLAGAFRAASHGARVALLEPSALGGTCVNVGCVPKKAMWLAAEVAGKLRQAGTLGFPAANCTLDWPTFIAHRERYIEGIHASYRRRLDEAGIALMPTRGAFVDARRVRTSEGVTLSASHVLIATGGHPIKPEIPGAELGSVSDDFFAWRAPPASVAVVGGGYIAVELAGVLQALGSRVSLRVRGEQPLTGFDDDITAQLVADYRQSGVDVRLSTPTLALERTEGGIRLRGADGAWSEPVEQVLFATGRQPNTTGLGLDAAGIAVDLQGFVPVDPFNRTSVEGVYAVGDVTPSPALTPVAIAAARRLMDRVFGRRERAALALDDVPTVVFSHPPIGRVGLSERAARAMYGDDVQVLRSGFRPMLNALSESPQRSLFKIVCTGEERRVVGLHLLGDAADEMLQGFAVAMRRGLTLDDLHDTIAIHPTSAEEVVLMR